MSQSQQQVEFKTLHFVEFLSKKAFEVKLIGWDYFLQEDNIKLQFRNEESISREQVEKVLSQTGYTISDFEDFLRGNDGPTVSFMKSFDSIAEDFHRTTKKDYIPPKKKRD